MSRLQKKKTVSEKKKTTVLDNQTDTQANLAKASMSKPAVLAGAVKKKSEKKIVASTIGEPNFFQRAIEFLREVQVELKKVTWPTRKQTTGTTVVVVIFVFIVAAFLGVFDFGLSKLVQIVLT